MLDPGFLGHFGVSADNRRALSIFGSELLDFTAAGGGKFVREATDGIAGFDGDLIFASNFDGARVYGVDVPPNRILIGNAVSGAALGTLTSGLIYRSLLVTRQGRIFVLDDHTRFHAYAPDGSELVTPAFVGSLPGTHECVLSATGDGHFGTAVSLTPDSTVHIIPVAP